MKDDISYKVGQSYDDIIDLLIQEDIDFYDVTVEVKLNDGTTIRRNYLEQERRRWENEQPEPREIK